MKHYRLPVTMHQPGEDTEFRYMAEIPILLGCRAWSYTSAEALATIKSVAVAFILSYQHHGHPLPDSVEASAYDWVGTMVTDEVTVCL